MKAIVVYTRCKHDEEGVVETPQFILIWQDEAAPEELIKNTNPKANPSVYEFKSRMGGEDTFYIGAFEATTSLKLPANDDSAYFESLLEEAWMGVLRKFEVHN